MWDVHAGRILPGTEVFVGGEIAIWTTLSEDLAQSSWRPSTRRLYQGWLAVFLALCTAAAVAPLPIPGAVLELYITRIAHNYAFGTLQIAISAVIGFCTLNNFGNPLKLFPRCKIMVDAAKKNQIGPTSQAKVAIDAPFILDMWAAMGKLEDEAGSLTIVDKRARCFSQLAFEAALRGGELHHLKVCDLMFVVCGVDCGKLGKCRDHKGSNAWVFVRLAKGARDGKVQSMLLVWPVDPVHVRGRMVSSLACLVYDWLPFLATHRIRRHPACVTTPATRYRCEHCPPLFPTFPSRKSSVMRAIDTSAVTKAFKRAALLAGRDPEGLTSHSARLGGYSTATAHECMPEEAARQLRWASSRVPERAYKRQNVQEETAVGEAIHRGLAAAVPIRRMSTPRACDEGGSTPIESVHGAVSRSRAGPTASATRPTPRAAAAGLGVAVPIKVERTDGRQVCRPFQLGMCPQGVSCTSVHVCFACGKAHAGGRLCQQGQQELSSWLAGRGAGVQTTGRA